MVGSVVNIVHSKVATSPAAYRKVTHYAINAKKMTDRNPGSSEFVIKKEEFKDVSKMDLKNSLDITYIYTECDRHVVVHFTLFDSWKMGII